MKNKVTETIKERFQDPLIGTYIISFGLWNWKIWLVLLSNEPYYTKISLIETFLSPASLLIPLSFVFIYNFVIPYFGIHIYRIAHRLRIRILNTKLEEDRELIHHRVIIEQLKNQIKEISAQCETAREKAGFLLSQNNHLKVENDLLLEQKNSTRKEFETIQRKCLDYEKENIEYIEKINKLRNEIKLGSIWNKGNLDYYLEQLHLSNLTDPFLQIAEEITTNILNVESAYEAAMERQLRQLLDRDLIRIQGSKKDRHYELTDLGRRILKKTIENEKAA